MSGAPGTGIGIDTGADPRRVEIGGGQHRQHTGRGVCRAGVDAANIGKGVRRADKNTPGRAVSHVVILKIAGAGQQPVILQPRLERPVHPPPFRPSRYRYRLL
ncbi:MAG TPA: hypothetical protein VMI30_09445 [Stellaceae bacterium]|nr:hypothetical protein [Stellaceae bacterium]